MAREKKKNMIILHIIITRVLYTISIIILHTHTEAYIIHTYISMTLNNVTYVSNEIKNTVKYKSEQLSDLYIKFYICCSRLSYYISNI